MEPIPVIIDFNGAKLQGFIMKLNLTGALVELDSIPFRVGGIVTATFETEPGRLVTEQFRSIKHYDRFFRQVPKKKGAEDPSVQPKKLAEMHFVRLNEVNRMAISKFLIGLQTKVRTGK